MITKEFMTTKVISCLSEKTIQEAAQLMSDKNISALPVVDAKGSLLGIVTESDFVGKEVEIPHALANVKRLLGQTFFKVDIEEIFKKAKDHKISEVMTKSPTFVTPSTTLTDVVNLMMSKNFKRFPVVEDGKLVGIVTRKDVLKAFIKVK